VCVWQEGLGDVKKVVIKETASVKEAVSDAADEVVDGVEKMLREEDE